MAAIPTCVIKSVTLAAGESYVLPPGAQLIGATHLNFTSTCEIPTLETTQCYFMSYAISENRDPSVAIEGNEYRVTLIYGTDEFVILDALSDGHAGSWYWITGGTPLTNVLPAGIILNEVVTAVETGDRHATTFTFDTIPSVAATIKLKIEAPGFVNGMYIFPTVCAAP